MKIVITVCALMIIISGCGAERTPENPLGIDPNEAQVWFNAGVESGQALQAVGIATGEPAIIGYGAALAMISGYLAILMIGKEKKNAES